MPSLLETQRAFAAGVLADEETDPGFIVAGRFTPAERLRVYRNNFRASLRAALADIYPVLERLVGEGFFSWLAMQYLHAHPSRSGNLHDFGEHLPVFLAAFEAADGHPYLPDVARLEWAWHRAFHAPGHAPLAVDTLAAVAPEQQERLRLRLHPAAHLLGSPYPVASIWEVNQPGHKGDQDVDLGGGGEQVLVSRPADDVLVQRLAAGEYALLLALARDLDLGEACETALEAEPAVDLGECLRRHVLRRTVVGFVL